MTSYRYFRFNTLTTNQVDIGGRLQCAQRGAS
jgi:hypothetical protein